MFELRVENGPDKGRVFTLREGVNSIGRGAANFCPINDVSVSRSHCAITIVGERAVIENKSRYGTLVVGTPIEAPFPLTDGQMIRLGYSLTEMSFHTVVEKSGLIEAVEPASRLAAAPVERSEAERLSSRKSNVEGTGTGKPLNDDSLVSGFPPIGGVQQRKPDESVKPRELVSGATPPAERKSRSSATDEEMESEIIVRQDVNASTDASSDGSKFIPIDKKLLADLRPVEPPTRMDTGGLVHAFRQIEIKKHRMRFVLIVAVLFGLGIVLTAVILLWN